MNRKHSRKREAIVEYLCSSREHPSADTVYGTLKEDFPTLSLGTVYRNIALLRNDGVIKSVGVVNGEERFDGDLTNHPHFVCNSCGTIIDIYPEDFDYEINKNALSTKYEVTIERKHFVFYGSCAKCNKTNESGSDK